MAQKQGALPYDLANLLGGAVRILYADPAETDPASAINDVISMVYPYAPKTGWVDLGATKESFTYSRNFEVEGWAIQQETGNVHEEVTEMERTMQTSLAEFREDIMGIIENSQSFADVAAAQGVGAQKIVHFGSFTSPNRYRFAFISRRAKNAGLVTEGSGASARKRGRFTMGSLHQVQIAADEAEIELEKGTLAAAGVSFASFPDDDASLTEEESYGIWAMEDSGTITTA